MVKIYLISPPKIELKDFSTRLRNALNTGLIPTFQLRLKGYEKTEVKKIATEIKKICDDSNCLFILNDDYKTALDLGLSGVHVGSEDGNISEIRKISPQSFVIGASCYDSRDLAMQAAADGADYLSFGTFFPSKTKNSQGKPTTEILTWCDELLELPTVAIGGITDENCDILVKAKADFLAVISYVWQHSEGEAVAIEKLEQKLR
jgi:thiamine-phosphate pyrophosphorylase